MPPPKKEEKKRRKARKKEVEPEPQPDFNDEEEVQIMVPEDQDKTLDAKDLEEEHTRILKAQDPNVGRDLLGNIERAVYNYQEHAFKRTPLISQTAVHHVMTGNSMHVDSEEAKNQSAVEAQIEENMKAVWAKLEAEKGEDDDEVEDAAALRNQFNFSERAMQTSNPLKKDQEVMTTPPTSVEMSATVTQWEIFDFYAKDIAEQERMKQREKERKGKKKKKDDEKPKPKKDEGDKDKEGSLIYSSSMQMSLKMVERAVNQNAFDDILQDFKYWEDESDQHKPESGTLLPLWQFHSQKTRHKMVTSLCWNFEHKDLFAVGYGTYDFTRACSGSTGVICCFSLKNPSSPEFVYNIDSGVMCLDFNSVHAPAMLAVGLYDGSVLVYDLSKKDTKTGGCDKQPIIKSDIKTKKHMDPVWQVRWHTEELSGALSFLSISTDGKMMQWTLTTNELQVAVVMQFKLLLDDGIDADETQLVGLAGATCFDFNKDSSNLFVVGTEEGDIYKCSTAYSTEYLMAYEGHDMNVYAVKYNYYHPRAFLSCSADWTVKLWDHNSATPIMSRDLGNAVSDIAWAPFSSTVFAAVTADAKVHVFDLAQNKYEALCEQKVIRKAKLTHISFNPVEPIILVGDDRGVVTSLKLSPNLRKLTEVASHKDEKSGLMKPIPKDPEELKKWKAEELQEEIDKLDQVMERMSQQTGDKKGDGVM